MESFKMYGHPLTLPEVAAILDFKMAAVENKVWVSLDSIDRFE